MNHDEHDEMLRADDKQKIDRLCNYNLSLLVISSKQSSFVVSVVSSWFKSAQ